MEGAMSYCMICGGQVGVVSSCKCGEGPPPITFQWTVTEPIGEPSTTAERRKYALLQAAAIVSITIADTSRSVAEAYDLLAEIERREGAK